MKRLTHLILFLASILAAGCTTNRAGKSTVTSEIHGSSTISIGTYGNVPAVK